MLKIGFTLRQIISVCAAAAPKPPPDATVSDWLRYLGILDRDASGRILLSAAELAVVCSFAWLRLVSPLKIQDSKRLARRALKLLNRGESTVLIVLTTTRGGSSGAVHTAPVEPAPGVSVLDVGDYAERSRTMLDREWRRRRACDRAALLN